MKKSNRGILIIATLLIIFNVWGFTTNTFTFVKPIMIVVDLIVAYFLFMKFKGSLSFLKSNPTSDKKNFCPECGQRVDTPTCKSCGRELKP